MELEDKDLSFNYRTHCDPRLNYEQSLGPFFFFSCQAYRLTICDHRRRVFARRLPQVKEKRRKTA